MKTAVVIFAAVVVAVVVSIDDVCLEVRASILT